MVQEDKDLLLKYLCMALPYRVKGLRAYNKGEVVELSGILSCIVSRNSDRPFIELQFTNLDCCVVDKYKPYLRPMSSMTEKEKKEISNLLNYEFYVDVDYALSAEDDRHRIRLDLIQIYTNWLLKNRFDFMGLIPKGLAIEVTNGNNPYEN